MDAYDAILTRRSVPKVTQDPPDRSTIQRLLDAAVRAPTHHLTQPWRFVVLSGDARKQLGEAWAAGVEAAGGDASKVVDKTLRAPVIICVIEKPALDRPKVVEIEEHYATGAAMQNILLAAHAMGLGAMLRTGPAATLPEVCRFLQLTEGEFVAGFIYVGYPPEGDDERNMSVRKPAEEVTQWRGWE